MSTESEPRWDLLPHDPQAFFGLAEGFDLKDLKRSYNAYLRRFKPEKFPAEFQRIRDAYEELSNELRYGEVRRGPTIDLSRFAWTTPATHEPAARTPGAPSPEVPAAEHTTLRDRLATEDPQDLFRELKKRQFKSPYDYFALAVLSDVVGDNPLSFAGWLLAGLKEHANEPALFQLLRDYFYSQPPYEHIRKLLLKTAEVVRSDRFYYLTECLWDRLLRSTSFATFRKTLETCEAQLHDCQVGHQITFYIHILKGAIFKADRDWIDERLLRVEECHDQLSPWDAFELDILEFFKVYADRQTEFLKAGGPIRALIDRTIVDYCTLDELEADRKFFECQMKLTANSSQLMQEFDVPSEGLAHVVFVWERIAAEVLDRAGKRRRDAGAEPSDKSIRGLAYRLMQEGQRARLQSQYYSYMFFFVIGGALALIVVLASLGYRSLGDLFWRSEWVSGFKHLGALAGTVVAAYVWLMAVIRADMWLCKPVYRKYWRREFMAYFSRVAFRIPDVADRLATLNGVEVKDQRVVLAPEIAQLLRSDAGMIFYVTAQRMLE